MKRILSGLLLLSLVLLCGQSSAQSGNKESKVKVRLKSGKTEDVTGVITDESLAGISIKAAKGPRKIAAEDIVDVEYPPPSFETSAELRKARNTEAKGKYEEAVKLYQKIKVADKKLSRHVEFKIAALTAKESVSDATQRKVAIDLLSKFQQKNPDCWQIIDFPKLLVPLQLKEGDASGAQKTLTDLASAKNLPEGLRQECNLMSVRILLDSKRYDDAEAKLATLIKGLKDENQILRLRITLAECMAGNKKLPAAKKELSEIIAKTPNPDYRALALNALGESCKKNGELREAMWHFLYVDVLYNQNKDEHLRAIRNLVEVFTELKETRKAKQYSDMLKK